MTRYAVGLEFIPCSCKTSSTADNVLATYNESAQSVHVAENIHLTGFEALNWLEIGFYQVSRSTRHPLSVTQNCVQNFFADLFASEFAR